MFSFSCGLAALALETGALVSLFSYGNSQTLLFGYLGVHALASALAAWALIPLLTPQQRSRPLRAFVFFFAIAFFIPVLGIAGLGAMLIGRLMPEKVRGETIMLHEAPVYDPRAEEIASVRSKGGARVQLGNTAAPVETRLKALLAVQALPARVANPMVREILTDPSDDLRLVAYGILDAREKSINARIHASSRRLASLPPARERAQLERQLADLYWELVYQGLVQGDLREHALAQSRAHLDQALSLDPEDAGLWALCGRLAAHEGDYGEAERAFARASQFGLPEARVLPYLAEVAFRQRRFDEVRRLAGRLAAGPQVQRLSQVIRYWGLA